MPPGTLAEAETLMNIEDCKPGQRVRIRQEIERREGDWHLDVTGTVQSIKKEKTGSWFAHSKDNKYWLYRIRLQKEDGELTTITVDQYTEIEVLEGQPASA